MALLLTAFFVLTGMSVFRPLSLNQILFSKINLFSYYFYDLAAFFGAGAILKNLSVNFQKLSGVILPCVLLLIGVSFKAESFPLLFPVFFIALGQMKLLATNRFFAITGDLFYGIYIWIFNPADNLSFFKTGCVDAAVRFIAHYCRMRGIILAYDRKTIFKPKK